MPRECAGETAFRCPDGTEGWLRRLCLLHGVHPSPLLTNCLVIRRSRLFSFSTVRPRSVALPPNYRCSVPSIGQETPFRASGQATHHLESVATETGRSARA